jgi:hypothetical protein
MIVRVWHLGLVLLLIVLVGGFYVTHGTAPSVATTTPPATDASRTSTTSAAAGQGSLDAQAAEANVRTLIPSIESYAADNTPGNPNDPNRNHSDRGYTGMTIAIVRRTYDQATPSYDWVNPSDSGYPAGTAHVAPTKRNYCSISKVGRVYAWQLGPRGVIKTSTSAASVCRA